MNTRNRVMLATIGLAGMALLAQCAVGAPAASPDRAFVRMAPCPESPNCVSTLADPSDSVHFSAPLTYTGSLADAKARLLAVVNAMPRTKIVEDDGDYLRVEYRSLIFRFVDDVEFQFDDVAKAVQFRSAARLGYGDMGVNRKRMDEIRASFQQNPVSSR